MDYVPVVEGVDERQPGLGHDLPEPGLAVLEGNAMLDHLRAVGPGGRDLGRIGVFRYQDEGVQANRAGRQRQGLGVVAGADRDDPSSLGLALLEGEDGVEGAARLEGAGDLEALGLKAQLAVEVGGQERGAPHVGADALGRGGELGQVAIQVGVGMVFGFSH